jgi:hypothetical protein
MTDEMFDAVAANTAKTGITTSQASAITANTAKVTYDNDLSNTNNMGVVMTVTENRGTYALVFTMTHGKVVKTATVALS